jgi:hypothetical protein
MFKELESEFVKLEVTGKPQFRLLIAQDIFKPKLRIYIYKEANHNRPHIHVEYGEEKISISLNSTEILAGKMRSQYLGKTLSWAEKHKEQLHEKWVQIQNGEHPELVWKSNIFK